VSKHQNTKTALERFYEKFEVADSGCWNWTAATVGLHFNYGKFWLNGKYGKAHRASYILHVAEIPNGLWVLHKCDNPSCVNPEHLFLGSRQDNVNDMLSKKRGGQHKNPPKGDRRKDSKLTEAAVRDILKRCSSGESQSNVAKLYGVGQPTVHKIVHKQRWAHIV